MPGRWFTTCQLLGTRLVEGRFQPVPASTAHAKEMGTLRSMCGVDVSTWHKLWDLPFTPHRLESCPECSTAVGRRA